ncbi:hypothetical protein HPULCUR_000589 [Helicostylum pulchrum]|uniref:Uncharacterized protein n=1 Tax=Helicostylum pulchrum TaxID=562976 RepID=A0ABP9XKB0_9FUNG
MTLSIPFIFDQFSLIVITFLLTYLESRPDPKPITRTRRHYSISSRPEINFFTNTPTLSPSTSSSTCSSSIWNDERRLSKVEGMIQLFEMGGHKPQRRYSVDSHNYNRKQFIRERKFKFEPMADEWKKRANSNQNSPVQLTVSASTPVKRKMAPIPERSKSTWA